MPDVSHFFVRLFALAHKELLHVVRDPQVIYLALGMPLVMLFIFGYAVTFDLDEVHLAVLDRDSTPASRQFLSAMSAGGTFRLGQRLEREDQVEALFRQGAFKGVVVIPAGFARDLARGRTADVQLLMDGADGTTTRIALGYAMGVGQQQSIKLLRASGAGGELPIEPRVRTWFNPQMRSAVFVVPGLVAVILTMLSVLLSALSIAREWERGSMEQLFTTPVGRLSVVLGKLLPYVGLGILQFLLVIAMGAYLFDVPLRGSLMLLAAVIVLFLVCVLGQGLFISTVTRNQQVATQVGAVSAMLPSVLLSGFMFPVENMPWFLQALSHIVPARYMITCLRGILLQGRGLAELWPSVLGLAVLATVLITLTTIKFRRRLD